MIYELTISRENCPSDYNDYCAATPAQLSGALTNIGQNLADGKAEQVSIRCRETGMCTVVEINHIGPNHRLYPVNSAAGIIRRLLNG